MIFKYIMFMALSAVSINSCDREVECDLFDYSNPVDLSYILQAYDWQQGYEEDDEYTILWSKIVPGIP